MSKINPKEYFRSKRAKNKNHHQILDIRISLGSKFQLQQIILIFWNKFPKKRTLLVKKRKDEHHHWFLRTRISLSTKFQLKLTILIFWTKSAQKGYFQSKIDKINIPRILHIQISLGIKVYCEQVWIFGSNLPKKDISSQKQKKWTPPLNSAYWNEPRYQTSA